MSLYLLIPGMEAAIIPILDRAGIPFTRFAPKEHQLVSGDILLIRDPIWIKGQALHVCEVWQSYLKATPDLQSVSLLKTGVLNGGPSDLPWVDLLAFHQKIPEILKGKGDLTQNHLQIGSFQGKLKQWLEGHGNSSIYAKIARLQGVFNIVDTLRRDGTPPAEADRLFLIPAISIMKQLVAHQKAYQPFFEWLPAEWQLDRFASFFSGMEAYINGNEEVRQSWDVVQMASLAMELEQTLRGMHQAIR